MDLASIKLSKCRCGQKPRLCHTGRKWLITCDTEDCARREFGKTSDEVVIKWNGKARKNGD